MDSLLPAGSRSSYQHWSSQQKASRVLKIRPRPPHPTTGPSLSQQHSLMDGNVTEGEMWDFFFNIFQAASSGWVGVLLPRSGDWGTLVEGRNWKNTSHFMLNLKYTNRTRCYSLESFKRLNERRKKKNMLDESIFKQIWEIRFWFIADSEPFFCRKIRVCWWIFHAFSLDYPLSSSNTRRSLFTHIYIFVFAKKEQQSLANVFLWHRQRNHKQSTEGKVFLLIFSIIVVFAVSLAALVRFTSKFQAKLQQLSSQPTLDGCRWWGKNESEC